MRSLVLAFLPLLALGAPAVARAAAPEGEELLVRFRPGVDAADRTETRRAAGVTLADRLPLGGVQLVRVDPGRPAGDVQAELERDPDVLYAEPNAVRVAFRMPADPLFPFLWALDNSGQVVHGRTGTPDADVDAPEAWDVTAGSPDVTVAVMDSGVDLDHPDLVPGLAVNAVEAAGRPGADDDGNGFPDDVRGWDFVEDDGSPQDLFGHGTHVAGTIGARIDNGQGVVGVAPGTRILPVRTLDRTGVGEVDDAIRAYAYASRMGARVLNASFGGPRGSTTERDAIRAAGLLIVAASGNGGGDRQGDDLDERPSYPCAYELENVVCVGASDAGDGLAPFSDYGARTVDLAAPGTAIQSTVPRPSLYDFADGSSMAAPHVSGAAALLWAKNPVASVGQVRAALLGGADRAPLLNGLVVTGGRLNARTALDLMPPPPPPPPPASPASGLVTATRADLIGPRLSMRAYRAGALGRALREGVRMRVRCSERCVATLRLVADARTARHLRLGRRSVVIARATFRVSRSRARSVALELTLAGRRALRRTRRVDLVLLATARDAAGNRTRSRRVLTLRR